MQTLHLLEFGPFRLNVTERFLMRGGEVVPLTPKVFDTLLVLVENSGHVLGKDELLEKLWPDSFVEESSLAQNISLLRKALGEASGARQYIETVPKRGYRFVADVREIRNGDAEIVMQKRTETHILIEEQEESTEDEVSGAHERAVATLSPVKRRLWPSRKVAAVVSVFLILTVAAAGYLLWSRSSRRAGALSGAPRSVAVLPFKPLGAESDNELLGLGVADALIVKLSNLRRVRVLPTSSIFKYGGRDRDSLAIGRELGVDAVLDGTVQHAGERVRVTAQLVNIADGRTLWSGKFDQKFNDIFALQDSISEQLARALALQITQDERQLFEKRYTQNPEAYQAYMTGIFFWNKRTKDGLTKAIEYFQKAIELDPNYAQAYAALSDCYHLSNSYRYDIVPFQEARQKMIDTALRSFELDNNLSESNLAIATVRFATRDPLGAGQAYRRAIELNPNHAIARLRFANFLRYGMRLEPALQQMRKAQELDPTSALINSALANYLLQARLYDEAIKYGERAIELDPDAPNARLNLGEAYVQKGMYNEAIAQYQMMKERLLSKQAIAYAYAVAGRRDEAQKLLSEILQIQERERVPAYNIAMIYTGLGDKDRAFEWLEKNRVDASVIILLKYDPQLDPLRADPRFAEYLRRRDIHLDVIAER